MKNLGNFVDFFTNLWTTFWSISCIFLRNNVKQLVGSLSLVQRTPSAIRTCVPSAIHKAKIMHHDRSIFLSQVARGQDEDKDLCKEVVCPRGQMCVSLMDNGEKYTICQCPKTCPTELNEPVCSYYNRQFNSRCEMHKYACAHDLTMKVKNQGNCPLESKWDKYNCIPKVTC